MSNQDILSNHVVLPLAKHTHTAILLHGRGDNGPDFAKELFSSRVSDGASSETLLTRLPTWRWVFPSAASRWSIIFEEELPMWFEAHSLSDPTLSLDVQMNGIRESVADITKILEEEVCRLGGCSKNIVLGGISQGAAVGLWALLYQGKASCELGGFVGASCWLPFSSSIEGFLAKMNGQPTGHCLEPGGPQDFERPLQAATKALIPSYGESHSWLSTPIFLGHSTDDAYVDVTLGRQARDFLSGIGFKVMWKEYVGAEQEGHWYKEPEQLEDIAQFLAAAQTGQHSST